MNEPEPIRARVTDVVKPKKGEPYVVTYPTEGQRILPTESITFTLKFWIGGTDPIKGQEVILQQVNQHQGGLRAESAEPLRV